MSYNNHRMWLALPKGAWTGILGVLAQVALVLAKILLQRQTIDIEKKDTPMAKNASPPFKGFLEFRPRAEQRKAIKAALLGNAQSIQFVERLVLANLKISFSFDSYHDAYVISVTDKTENSPNAGYVLTCRHSDLVVALSSIRYLVEEIGDNVTWDSYIGSGDKYDW
jgi:hypothetical protein